MMFTWDSVRTGWDIIMNNITPQHSNVTVLQHLAYKTLLLPLAPQDTLRGRHKTNIHSCLTD